MNGVVVLENWYDAGSRRVAKKEVVNGQTKYTMYVWDGWDSAAVLNESAQVFETFTRGVGLAGDIGTLVAVTHHTGSTTNGTFYTHHNHRGDVVLTRSGTTTVGGYTYSAFGSLQSQTGTDVSRFKFSSKEWHANAGLYYYGYRYYEPNLQRWPNRDPIGERGGINLYACVRNNPINRIDPYGLAVQTDTDAESCFDNCKNDAVIAMLGAGGKAAGQNITGFGTGIIIAAVGLAVATKSIVAAVIIEGIATTIEIISVGNMMADLNIIKDQIKGDYAKCLNTCRKKYCGSDDSAADYWKDNPIK